ncbi:MAG: carbohydrate kinase [Roseburia sp.]|nr:carbohydrate kinase [Anaeroplasma bactoclasticum]MCM1196575.1 carbohydrate kinase [Roseburia sp.]
MSKLYSIGELLIDFQSVGTGSLKETKQFIKNAGGAPANVCVQAVKLGCEAVYLTQVGNDGFGDFLIEALKNEGVDVSYISKSNVYDTSLAFVSYKEDGEREFSFYRKMAADLYFTKEDFKNVKFQPSDILEFGSVALKTDVARQTHNDLIIRAKASKALIAFDPNLRLNLWENHEELKCVVKEYISYADIIKIGLDELEFITGKNEELAVKEILHKDLKVLLVTYGSHGARVYLRNNKSYYHPGYKVQAVDTTGAGDSFFGAFLAEVLAGGLESCDFIKALDMACKCGAYTTTGYGAIPAMGTKENVVKEIK